MTIKEVNEIKQEWLENIQKAIVDLKLTNEKPISINRGSMKYMVNEMPILIEVTIPKGNRVAKGFESYDGYMMAWDYEIEQEDRKPKEQQLKDIWQAKIADKLASDDFYCTDALIVGCSEVSFPVLDQDRNEIYVNVKITHPKGTRK